MNIREKLQDRINIELNMDVDLPESLGRSQYQRRDGDWSWKARDNKTGADIGSQVPMAECLKADSLWHIVD